jgi:hypothetical protein
LFLPAFLSAFLSAFFAVFAFPGAESDSLIATYKKTNVHKTGIW